MNANSETAIEIRLGGAIDDSLDESIETAIAQLGEVSRAAAAFDADFQSVGDSVALTTQAMVAQTQQAADQSVEIWASAGRELMSVDETAARDLFNKRQNLWVDLNQIGQKLAEDEIANDLKYWTERGLLALEGTEKEKMAEQGGVLQKLLMDQFSTTSTAESQTAQTAAVTTGVAARTASQSAGDASGLAMKAATTSLTISQDAAQAAAGAYASASQVPLIGWLLGPLAATGAFAAVMAYDSIASAEGGQWKVGGAEQITALHKDEMVWPGWAAHGARNMLSNFADGGFAVPSGGDNYSRSDSNATTHQWNYAPQISGVPERNVVDELRNNSAEFMSFIQGLTRGGAMRFA